jgi:hypothetical protein
MVNPAEIPASGQYADMNGISLFFQSSVLATIVFDRRGFARHDRRHFVLRSIPHRDYVSRHQCVLARADVKGVTSAMSCGIGPAFRNYS